MVNLGENGNQIMSSGALPENGSSIGNYTLVKTDLSEVSLESYRGQNVILNIFPSVDTGTCAASVRNFNQRASELPNTTILCISKDLPFALRRFCGAEGIDKVETLSAFRTTAIEEELGIQIEAGGMKGLFARTIVVLNPEGKVVHTQLIDVIGTEPDYEAALAAL